MGTCNTSNSTQLTMSWAAKKAKQAANAAVRYEKYTVQPAGIWGRINNFLAVDPKRSSGVPLNPHFRNPPPASNDPNAYDDPVTQEAVGGGQGAGQHGRYC